MQQSPRISLDPRIGTLVAERYRIERVLGEGGMGVVYEALHERIGKKIALKCLHPAYAADPNTVGRFHREARASSMIGSEHIVEVFDMGHLPDGAPFIAMEKLEGCDLAEVLRNEGPLSPKRIVDMLVQVCLALSAAHEKGIVHRDLKPENIFLVESGPVSPFVKVLDFGVSKIREHHELIEGNLTKTGVALGTPSYMAPEQAHGYRDVDGRADVYALGVILFEALTGVLPFDADTYPLLMVKVLTQPAPPLRDFRPDLPEELGKTIERALEKDRNMRFGSVMEFRDALFPFREIDVVPRLGERLVSRSQEETASLRSARKTEGQNEIEGSRDTGVRAKKISTFEPKSGVPSQANDGRVRRRWLLGFLLLLPAIGALSFFARVESATPRTPRGSTPSSRNSSENGAHSSSSAPDHPAEVELIITAAPPQARIFIGETEYPNPLRAHQPRQLSPTRIRIEAPGYEPISELAIFDRAIRRDYLLRRSNSRPTRDDPAGSERREVLSEMRGQPSDEPAPPPASSGSVTTSSAGEARLAPSPEPSGPAPSDHTNVYRGPTGTIRREFE